VAAIQELESAGTSRSSLSDNASLEARGRVPCPPRQAEFGSDDRDPFKRTKL
jgi:hypothetical protein